MTVAVLIKRLQQEDPKRIVVMSRDAEGNGYSPLYQVSTGAYAAESTWSGTVGLEPADLTPKARAQGFTKADVIDGKPALILYPTN